MVGKLPLDSLSQHHEREETLFGGTEALIGKKIGRIKRENETRPFKRGLLTKKSISEKFTAAF